MEGDLQPAEKSPSSAVGKGRKQNSQLILTTMSKEKKDQKDPATVEAKSRKGIGGPKPKPDSQKVRHQVGTFWLTDAEKQIYDRLFEQSGLKNHNVFFKNILFDGRLKLHYSDANTLLIYKELSRIKKEMNAIGTNFNQIATRVNSVGTDTNLFSSLKELNSQQEALEKKLEEIQLQVERLKALTITSEQSNNQTGKDTHDS